MYYVRVRQFMDKCKSLQLVKGLGKTEPQEAQKDEPPLLSPTRSKKQTITEQEILDGLGTSKQEKIKKVEGKEIKSERSEQDLLDGLGSESKDKEKESEKS